MNLKAYLREKRGIVDKALESYFKSEGPLSDLISAMEYSLLAGGKRLRPILCMAGAEAVGGMYGDVLPVACALEMIHTYSLIHDDLPLMDDDDMRRGKPTNHKVFGDAVALLAGDGLLTEAFCLMASSRTKDEIPPSILLNVIELIARAAGYRGMVGGQTADIQSEGKKVGISTVKFIHTHKTGSLITASVASGAILGGGRKSQIQAITAYGRHIGLAFQISDDILNVEGNSTAMGKSVGSDEQRGKITYPAVAGLKESKEIQSKLVEQAVDSLQGFDDKADPLREMAKYIIERKR